MIITSFLLTSDDHPTAHSGYNEVERRKTSMRGSPRITNMKQIGVVYFLCWRYNRMRGGSFTYFLRFFCTVRQYHCTHTRWNLFKNIESADHLVFKVNWKCCGCRYNSTSGWHANDPLKFPGVILGANIWWERSHIGHINELLRNTWQHWHTSHRRKSHRWSNGYVFVDETWRMRRCGHDLGVKKWYTHKEFANKKESHYYLFCTTFTSVCYGRPGVTPSPPCLSTWEQMIFYADNLVIYPDTIFGPETSPNRIGAFWT